MTIKDFELGQTAYAILLDNRSLSCGNPPERWTVNGIGRKYLKATKEASPSRICGGWDVKFREYELEDDCLVEDRDWGYKRILFRTMEELEEYMDKCALRRWIREEFEKRRFQNLTAGQLREIKKIIEGGTDGEVSA